MLVEPVSATIGVVDLAAVALVELGYLEDPLGGPRQGQPSMPGMVDRAKHRPFPAPRFITQAVAVVIIMPIMTQTREVTEELAEEEMALRRWRMQDLVFPTLAAVVAAATPIHAGKRPVQAARAS